MPIYTKTGDQGNTKVFNIKTKKLIEISKSSDLIDAIGNVDELNSHIGLIGSLIKDKKEKLFLNSIQNNLLNIGSILAGSDLKIKFSDVKDLEKQIDQMDESLPVLSEFILPGGGQLASTIHVTRSIARRAERSVVKINLEKQIDPMILSYLNRLSDYLFTLARHENNKEKIKDLIWEK